MTCPLCEIQNNSNAIIFEYDNFIGTLLLTGITKYHIKVATKEHNLEYKNYKLEIAKRIKEIIEKIVTTMNIKDFNFIMNLDNSNEFQHLNYDIILREENDNAIIGWIPNKEEKQKISETSKIMSESLKGYQLKLETKKEINISENLVEGQKTEGSFNEKPDSENNKNSEIFLFFNRTP